MEKKKQARNRQLGMKTRPHLQRRRPRAHTHVCMRSRAGRRLRQRPTRRRHPRRRRCVRLPGTTQHPQCPLSRPVHRLHPRPLNITNTHRSSIHTPNMCQIRCVQNNLLNTTEAFTHQVHRLNCCVVLETNNKMPFSNAAKQ